jgi:hypothetical protein
LNGPAHTWIGAISNEYESYIQITANKTMLESWIFINSRDYLLIGARTEINVKSTIALLVEQGGVKDNVLVVDTTNARVGVNCAPSYPLEVAGETRVRAVDTSHHALLSIYRLSNNYHAAVQLIPAGDLGASNKIFTAGLEGYTHNYCIFTWDGSTNQEIFYVTTDGRVGILDNAPAEALDVNGNINTTGVIKVDDVQVVSNRYIDSKINNNPGNAYDNPTKNLIACLKAMALHHGMVAAS